jgi:hypothetical protein
MLLIWCPIRRLFGSIGKHYGVSKDRSDLDLSKSEKMIDRTVPIPTRVFQRWWQAVTKTKALLFVGLPLSKMRSCPTAGPADLTVD